MPFTTRARAKVNVSLQVLGRRPSDGYHELASLVAFADIGDDIVVDPEGPQGVCVEGVFGGAIVGENIVDRTLDLLAQRYPKLRLGRVTITKNLPVASGLGGGSANAAAVLRAVSQINPACAEEVDWMSLAAELGADVPVCLLDRASWVTGIGEHLEAIEALPDLPIVLVNPQTSVPADKTVRVFKALGAGPSARPGYRPATPAASLTQLHSVIEFARAHGNDLAAPAQRVVPKTADVLKALNSLRGCRHASVSGAGPTCFGLFDSLADADTAAIARDHPGWWVWTGLLRSAPCG